MFGIYLLVLLIKIVGFGCRFSISLFMVGVLLLMLSLWFYCYVVFEFACLLFYLVIILWALVGFYV